MNLDRRPDRLKTFITYYNNSDLKNLSINKLNAIDGSQINLDTVPLTDLAKLEMKQLETTGFRYKHYQLTKGAIGCYLSHVKIWENMIRYNHDKVLIFEDDARVPPNALYSIKKIVKDIPIDWDIILLGKFCNECEDKGTYYKVKRFILLHSYLITRKGVEKIINAHNLFPISQQLDAYLSEISDILNIYAPKINIVNQSNSRTDIQAPIIKNYKNNYRMLLEKKKVNNE
jgi:GR25 family glycosyltransferase involved in LPS biosynthesis